MELIFIVPLIYIGPTYIFQVILYVLYLATPDSGAGLAELDQAAAAGVGVISLGITALYTA